MKVLFVSALYHPYSGGAERIVRILSEGLVKAGHQATVICNSQKRGCRQDDLNGVKIYRLGLRNLYWPFDGYRPPAALRAIWAAIDAYNPLAAKDVARVLDIEQPSLVNTHTLQGFSALVWVEVKRRKLPLMHTLHDYWLMCRHGAMYTRGAVCETPCTSCRIYSKPRRRLSRLVDAVSSDGNFVLQKHLQASLFGEASPRRWIHNASNAQVGTRPRACTAPHKLRLGYLGQIIPVKGVDALLRTLGSISGGWELLVGGRGNPQYEESLKRQYASPEIQFLGFVRPGELLARIDVLVVPSLWNDPLPTVIFEAYSHGVPVIGSRRGGIPELIDDGKTGFLFSPEVPGGLEEAIRRFLHDPGLADRMSPDVLAKARHYNAERLVGEYLALYSQILGDN
jgi:glycosyltransferase involved in cell wall biosynthesis